MDLSGVLPHKEVIRGLEGQGISLLQSRSCRCIVIRGKEG